MKEKEFLPLVAQRLGIQELNKMQRRMMEEAQAHRTTVLLSPTGSGKTLAFLLPVLKMLKQASGRVQCLIIAPSRELVLQIYGIVRDIATGYKAVALYGGHNVQDEVNSLQSGAEILVATPGRMLDHIRRRNIDVLPCRILVLDEFDKTLELGFQEEMSRICRHTKNISRVILTSATPMTEIPAFVPTPGDVHTFSYLAENEELKQRLKIHNVPSADKDKLEALMQLLLHLTTDAKRHRVIIFASHRQSAERIAAYLKSRRADTVLYSGALDQQEREKAVARFNNGSAPIMVATDLASRGLDIEGVTDIIHYHLPDTPETFTHRNGRTARAYACGDVYLLTGPTETLPGFVKADDEVHPAPSTYGENIGKLLHSDTATIHISAGRKEKLSRRDIVGFLISQGGLQADEIGRIDVRDHYALVAVPADKAQQLLRIIDRAKIKGERRKFSLM